MKTREFVRPPAGSARRVVAVAVALSVAGCGMLSPFHHTAVLRQPDPPAKEAGNQEASADPTAVSRPPGPAQPLSATLAGGPPGVTMAGGVLEALQETDRLRREYHDNLAGSSRLRQGAVLTANVLTGWGLYNALKPVAGAASGATATEGDKRRTVRIGASLAALYGLSQFFVNDDLEKSHTEGYEALTCLMLQSRPFLMTAPITPSEEWKAATTTAERLSHLNSLGITDYERLVLSLKWLEEKIFTLNQSVATSTAALHPLIASEDAHMDALAGDLKQARRALALARNALRDGHKLKATIDRGGAMISERTGIIVAGANARAQEAQKDIKVGKDLLTEGSSLTDAFIKLGIDTATDEKTGDGDKEPAGDSTSGLGLAGPVLAGSGWLTASMASVGLWLQGSAATPAAIAGQQAAAAASTPSSGPVPAAPASQAKPKPKPKPPAAKPAANPASAAVTRAELDQAIDRVLDLVADPEKQKKRLEEKTVEARIKAAVDQAIAPLDKTIKQLKRRLIEEKVAKGERPDYCTPEKSCKRESIQTDVEELFALRRPVVQAVLNFRELSQQVRTVGACSASASGLQVHPADDRVAKPGDTLEFLMSQRDKGNPMVALQGDPGVTPDKALAVTVQGDAVKATVSIGKEAPRGALTLVVTDSKGRDTERVFIFVKPKK